MEQVDRTKLVLFGIINLANTLGLEVVADRVETKEEFDVLLKTSCQVAQGFYFYKPLSASEITKLLTRSTES